MVGFSLRVFEEINKINNKKLRIFEKLAHGLSRSCFHSTEQINHNVKSLVPQTDHFFFVNVNNHVVPTKCLQKATKET